MYSNDYSNIPPQIKVWKTCPCVGHNWGEATPYCWDCGGKGGWEELVDDDGW